MLRHWVFVLGIIAHAAAQDSIAYVDGQVIPGALLLSSTTMLSATAFFSNLSSNGIVAAQRQTFPAKTFPGLSFQLASPNQTHLDTIGNFTQVKRITPVQIVQRWAPIPAERLCAVTVEALQQRALKSRTVTLANNTFSPHVMTGVDKLHAEGWDGAGIRIAIVDSGVDYTLPALGGGFGPGYKVAFGTDLVGDWFLGGIYYPPIPDDDPQDCLGHGTHVAGIVGASNDPYIIGVAPAATLGFVMAHKDGADVITASLGLANGWPGEAFSAAIAAIVSAGAPCMVAAGNAGDKGMYYAAQPASGTDVTSIGSVDNILTPAVLSLGNMTGKIALIRRGICTFDTKVQAALNAGAEYVIFYNNEPGVMDPLVNNFSILSAGMTDPETGAAWIKALSEGHTVTLTFSAEPEPYVTYLTNTLSGGKMSTYSTWADGGGYAVMSGTSMATPLVAGVVALYLQKNGKTSPKLINNALAATAKPVNWNDGSKTADYLASVAQQGAGLVDAYHMLHPGIKLSEANIALNDTANFVKTPAFYVENAGTAEMTYELTHEPAANSYSRDVASTRDAMNVFPPPMDTKYSSVTISPSTLTIKPGAKKRVTIKVAADPSLNSTLIPVYSGFVKVSATSGGEVVRIPYAGVVTKMNDITIFGATHFSNPYHTFGYTNYTGSDGVTLRIRILKPSVRSTMNFYFNNVWSTPSIRADVVSLDGPNPLISAGMANVGSVRGYPMTFVSRQLWGNGQVADFNGTFIDGTNVKNGVYKIVIRASKAFGDLQRGREYEEWESAPFYMDMS